MAAQANPVDVTGAGKPGCRQPERCDCRCAGFIPSHELPSCCWRQFMEGFMNQGESAKFGHTNPRHARAMLEPIMKNMGLFA